MLVVQALQFANTYPKKSEIVEAGGFLFISFLKK